MIFSVFQKNRVFGYSRSTLLCATNRTRREILCLPYAGFLWNEFLKPSLFCSTKYKNTAGEAVVLVNSLQGTGHERQVYMVVMSPPKTRGNSKTRPIKKYKYTCSCRAGDKSVFCKHVGATLILYFTQPFWYNQSMYSRWNTINEDILMYLGWYDKYNIIT